MTTPKERLSTQLTRTQWDIDACIKSIERLTASINRNLEECKENAEALKKNGDVSWMAPKFLQGNADKLVEEYELLTRLHESKKMLEWLAKDE